MATGLDKYRDIIHDLYLATANHVVSRIPSYSLRHSIYRHIYRMRIGKNSHVSMGVRVLAPWKIVIGDNVIINSGCLLDGRRGLTIGDNVDISWDVFIFTLEHDHDDPNYKTVGGEVQIEDKTCIGTRATILPSLRIGTGAVIAAGSVVTKDVLPFTVVAGVPAKRIRDRSQNLTYTLNFRRWFH